MPVAKVDAKGRISIPKQLRELLGDMVELKPVGKNKVLISKTSKTGTERVIAQGRRKDLSELLDREPRRTGKPENPSPEEMKSIWSE